MSVRLLAIVAFVAACGGPIAGTRVRQLPAIGPAVATAKAADPGGIRVLANGRAGDGDEGLLATSQAELGSLWSDVGLHGEPPVVDFATHVVIGTNFEDGVCQPELVAANVDAGGTLTFEEAHNAEVCILLAVRVARVIAVPRAILPARFTWRVEARGGAGYAFELARRETKAVAVRPIDTGARRSIQAPRGMVALPAAGRIALRMLDDGRQVWVAHRAPGDISVIAADRETDRDGVSSRVSWNAKAQRFWGDHDSRGRSVHGRDPLDVLAFARLPDDRIAIGEVIDAGDAPPLPRTLEPMLDGPSDPYEDVGPRAFGAIAEGQFGVVAHDLVGAFGGPRRLCTLPEGKLRQYARGCAADAPAFAGAHSRSRKGVDMLHGPFVVRRRGAGFDLVIDLGKGHSGWVVEERLRAPAARGPTRARGSLTVGGTVRGDTSSTADGFLPSCVPDEARGSPDESWQLAIAKTGSYVIELDSKYDGALAVVDANGKVLACNDDAKGYYRRSVLELELAAGAPVRIVVDGFGGHAGAYELTVHERPALQALVVGGQVTGDTTGAVDLESHGCSAPAGDHRYKLAIDDPGVYVFHIQTPGWAPMISVLDREDGFGCYTTLPPLVDVHQLARGTYFVVVDGGNDRSHGPYTLRVDRCATNDREACRAEAKKTR